MNRHRPRTSPSPSDARRLADRVARLDEDAARLAVRETRHAVDESAYRRAAVGAVDEPRVAAWRITERARLDRERTRLDEDAARLDRRRLDDPPPPPLGQANPAAAWTSTPGAGVRRG